MRSENYRKFKRRAPMLAAVLILLAIRLILVSGSGLRGGEGMAALAAPMAQLARLESSDLEQYDHFGYSIGFDGDTVVVGATQEDGGPGNPTTSSGAVYVFERNAGGAGSWVGLLGPGSSRSLILSGTSPRSPAAPGRRLGRCPGDRCNRESGPLGCPSSSP